MRYATIERSETGPAGTFGKMKLDHLEFFTLECPWKNNEKMVSSIPPGIYNVVNTFSKRFNQWLYLLEDVKDREGIRIHAANFASELMGCIALGKRIGEINGNRAILDSKKAMSEFSRHLNSKPFRLEIRNNYEIRKP